MDKSAARQIVEANIKDYKWRLQVQDWTVGVRYRKPDNPNWQASCERQDGYRQAVIELDPEAYEDDEAEKLLDSLRHELLHLVLAPFDLYRDVVTAGIEEGSSADAVEMRVWHYAVEQTLGNLERLLDHGLEENPFEKGAPEDGRE